MSRDLQTELTTYMSYLDTLVAPIAVEDSVRPRQVAPSPGSPWRGLAAAMGTALATLLLVGGIAWLAPLSGDSSPAGESTAPTTIGSGTAPSAGPAPSSDTITVAWVWTQWDEGQGPRVLDIVGTPSGLLGTGRTGGLWRSTDGVSWEPILTYLNDITVAGSGFEVLVAGVRDGSMVLLRSNDGYDWTKIDLLGLPLDQQEVVATTPSGLTWFAPDGERPSNGGVLAVVNDDRITEVHTPPWDPYTCCGITSLLEVGGSITAYQFDRNEPQFSRQWVYLGGGEWSGARDVTFSGEHAVVGDTALRVDQANSTCCGNPIRGTSLWPLLSSGDGVDWTEIAQIPAEDTHNLHVNAGSSFWIYGLSLGGGGTAIEVQPHTALGISKDGLTWQKVDLSQVDAAFFAEPRTGFIHVAGNTIFMANDTAYEGTGQYWVGTVDTDWDG